MKSIIKLSRLACLVFALACFVSNSLQAQDVPEPKPSTKPEPKPVQSSQNPQKPQNSQKPKQPVISDCDKLIENAKESFKTSKTIEDFNVTKNKLQESQKKCKNNATDFDSWIKKCDDRIKHIQDSIEIAEKRARYQRVELELVNIKFEVTSKEKKKEMFKESWLAVNAIVILADGEEISRQPAFETHDKKQYIKNRKRDVELGKVIKIPEGAKTISIIFTVTCHIERMKGIGVLREITETDFPKRADFKFNETTQKWEISKTGKDDIPFKKFVINEELSFQNIDFELNYVLKNEK